MLGLSLLSEGGEALWFESDSEGAEGTNNQQENKHYLYFL